MKNSLCTLWTAAVLVGLPAVASAQAKPAKPVTKAAPAASKPTLAQSLTGAAQSDYQDGVVLYREGKFQEAAIKFRAAYAQSSDGRLLWNEASAERQARNYARATELVQEYLAKTPDLGAADREEANKILEALALLTSDLTISVNVPGAEVKLNERSLGQSPIGKAVAVDAGSYTVSVLKENYQPYQTQLKLVGGEAAKLDVNLALVVTDAALTVQTNQTDSTIQLNGGALGVGSYAGRVAAGNHELSVSKDGFKPFSTQFQLQPNTSRSFEVTLEKEKSKIPAWALIAGGVLVAGAVGVTIYAIANADGDKREPIASGTFPPGIINLTSF